MEDISIGIAGLGERRPGAGIMGLPARSGHTLKICRDPTAGVQASNTPLVWWGSTIISCGSGDAIKCLFVSRQQSVKNDPLSIRRWIHVLKSELILAIDIMTALGACSEFSIRASALFPWG